MASGQQLSFTLLPVELKIRIMQELDYATLRKLVTVSPDAHRVLEANFHCFISDISRQVLGHILAPELMYLIYRTTHLRFTPLAKPWDAGPVVFAGFCRDVRAWLHPWDDKSDGNNRKGNKQRSLPYLPPAVGCLQYIHQLLESIRDWSELLQISIGEVCQPVGLAYEERLSVVELYKIRRALLLFQLYCELFRIDMDHRDYGFNGRVAEQMLFLQCLRPSLVGELDSIYGMVENQVMRRYSLCCVGRRSYPAMPGLGSSSSAVQLEQFMSRGLPQIKKQMGLDYSFRDIDRPRNIQNRFFNVALQRCWKFHRCASGTKSPYEENLRVVSYPTITPSEAPESADERYRPNVIWKMMLKEVGPRSRFPTDSHSEDAHQYDDSWRYRQLTNRDTSNARGLVFWDDQRVKRKLDSRKKSSETDIGWKTGQTHICVAPNGVHVDVDTKRKPYIPTLRPKSMQSLHWFRETCKNVKCTLGG